MSHSGLERSVGAADRERLDQDFTSVRELESRMQEYGKNTAARDKMKGYTDMYITGGRQIYQVLS